MMKKDNIIFFSIDLSLKYEKLKKIYETNADVFKPCEIKEIKNGIIRKTYYFIHFDGEKWEILEIKNKKSRLIYFFNK